MKILAFDNSTSTCTVALQSGSQVKSLSKTAPMLQAKLILPLIDELLTEFNLRLTDLDAIAYGQGPGSFTGIRIASSVAQGLGFAADIRLLPISSLAALAQATFLEHGAQEILVAVDARMEQVYWAHYSVNAEGTVELNGEEQLIAPQNITLPTADAHGAGDGWDKYPDQFKSKPKQIHALVVPNGEALLQLAKNQYLQGDRLKISAAIPVYLR